MQREIRRRSRIIFCASPFKISSSFLNALFDFELDLKSSVLIFDPFQVEISNEDFGTDLATVRSLSKSHSVVEGVLVTQKVKLETLG